ncbi:MAG: glycosyltransferase family 39 protein [Deltaproteobacteria bacterium]|nr:glycosyltransferase family 39 protein [Deltaproteobacteria bacterium]
MGLGAVHGLFGVPLAGVALWALVSSSLRIGAALVRGSRPVTTVVATMVVAHAQLLIVFEVLGAFGAFRLPVVMLAMIGTGVAARRLPSVELPLRGWFAAIGRPARLVAIAATALLVAKAARGMVAPTLAMDGTVYHIPRALLWLRSGGFARLGAPDVLEITDFHPPAGDVPWLYALSFARNESLVGWASAAITLEVAVAAYACARLLSADRPAAAACALAIVGTPAVMVYAGTAYVDNAVLALVLCGLALLVDAVERRTFGRALLTSMALTLAASVKVSAAVFLPLAAVVATVAAFRRLDRRWVLGWAAGLLLIVPHVVRCVVLRGSPIYPIGLSLFGHRIFAPNETFVLLANGKLTGAVDDPWAFLAFVFAPWLRPLDTTGFGLAFFVIAPLGLAGAWRTWRSGPRWVVVLLLAITVLLLGSVWSPAALAYRTEYAIHTSRYLTTAVAALALLSLSLRARWARVALLTAAGASLLSSVPRGFRALDAAALGPVALSAAAIVALAWILRRSPRARLATLAIGAWLVHVIALGSRAVHRDDYLTGLARRTLYDIHRAVIQPRGTARVWQALDRLPPSRVAITSGWTGDGMQLMISPLLGPNLEHTHLWVTPTTDGSVIDYREGGRLLAAASYEAWLRRLREQRVDVVACLAPPGLERLFIEQHREQFALIAASDDGSYAAFRLKP